MARQQAFAETITNNMRDLVSHTYTVSKQYSDDKPDLSLSYIPDRHRLDVTIGSDDIIIPLKYNRLNKYATLELFDEAKETAQRLYPTKGSLSEYDKDIIKDTHELCIKHMDWNVESDVGVAFFAFDAGNGELNSTIHAQGQADNRSITLVDAHCDRYGHLNESARLSYIRDEIRGQETERNRLCDAHLSRVQTTDVSLRQYITQPEDEVMLSFDGLDEQDQSQEL